MSKITPAWRGTACSFARIATDDYCRAQDTPLHAPVQCFARYFHTFCQLQPPIGRFFRSCPPPPEKNDGPVRNLAFYSYPLGVVSGQTHTKLPVEACLLAALRGVVITFFSDQPGPRLKKRKNGPAGQQIVRILEAHWARYPPWAGQDEAQDEAQEDC